jgi:hypothetical protein
VEHVHSRYSKTMGDVKVGIVVQGPYYGDRTRNICRYLLDNNTGSIVIFSSWKEFDPSEFSDIIEKYGQRFHLKQSLRPAEPGHQNRYLQRYSTDVGILLAETLQCTHVLKTRSDQLLRKIEVCEFLLNVQREYGDHRFVIGQSVTGPGPSINPPGWDMNISDYWMFGKTENMKLWYSSEGIDMTVFDTSSLPVESVHTRIWLKRKGLQYDSINSLLADYFVVIDHQTLTLVHKDLSLNTPEELVEKFWLGIMEKHSSTHAIWLELYSKTDC